MRKESELNQRTSPHMYTRLAKEHLDTYDLVVQKYKLTTDHLDIKYYLICRSLELIIKAYLILNGYSRKKIIEFKHDLEKLALEFNKQKITPTIPILNLLAINHVNQYYSTKDFEYPLVGLKSLPHMEDIRHVCFLLIQATDNRKTDIRQISKQLEDELNSVPIIDDRLNNF